MMFGNRWVEQAILPKLKEETDRKIKAYYCWRLETGNESYAHIFLCELGNEEELEKYWQLITNQIAVYVQCEVESLLERSNFYVWFFVKGEVKQSLQKKIEDDAYSSKKFVAVNKWGLTIKEQLELVQKRLFVFDFPFEKSDKQMIAKVEMRNFRTYKEKTFDFSSGDGSARLIVLFAPNGMGKTSFFDGIEWNFTGVIERFNELAKKKKSNAGEVILKNKEALATEDSYVKVCFNKGDCIKREVSKINLQTKRDTGKGNVSEYPGEELRRYLGMEEPWRNLILPHHKIDGFIAAKTPQDLYKEWGSLWDAGGEKRAVFEKSFKAKRQAEKEFEKAVEAYKNQQQKCEQLEAGRLFAQKLANDVAEFQKISGRDTLSGTDFNKISSEEYINWSNLVDQEMEYYQEKQNRQEEKLQYVHKELQADIEKYADVCEQLKDRENQLKKAEKELAACCNKKRFLLQEEEIEERRQQLIKEKEVYAIAKEQGKVWYEQGKVYFEIVGRKEKREEQIRELEESRIPKLENAIQRLELECTQKRKELEEEQAYKSLCEHRIIIEDLESKSEEIKRNIQKCAWECFVKQSKIEETRETIRSLKKKKLDSVSQVLQMYLAGILRVEENEKNLEKERIQLFAVVDSYNKRTERILEIDSDIALEERLEENIKNILEEARILIEQQKLTRCPVCDTDFRDEQKLLERTYRMFSEKGEQLKKERKEQEDWLKISEKYIEQGIEAYNNVLERILEELEEKWNSQMRTYAEEEQKKDQLERELNEYEKRIKRIQTEDQEKGIYVLYKKEAIDSWYVLWKEKQQSELLKRERRLHEEKMRLEEYANMHKSFLLALQSENATEWEMRQKMQETFYLLQQIEVLLKEKTYEEAEKRLYEIERMQKDLELQQQDLKEVLEKYSDITVSGEESYRQALSDLQESIQIIKSEEERISSKMKKVLTYEGINDFAYLLQENAAEKIEQGIESDLTQIEAIINLLRPLKYNNEVKNYFADWDTCQQTLKEKESEKKEKQKRKSETQKAYEMAKEKIETEMQDFLNKFQVNDIYQKLDPHEELKSLVSEFDISEEGKGELTFQVSDKKGKTYPPEWYFSTAQLNVVAFSVFLGRALQAKDVPIKSILIDDPIGHFDDMNIVGFVDLLRNIIENTDRQLIISTHEERVFGLIQRKLPKEFYPVKYIDFREN